MHLLLALVVVARLGRVIEPTSVLHRYCVAFLRHVNAVTRLYSLFLDTHGCDVTYDDGIGQVWSIDDQSYRGKVEETGEGMCDMRARSLNKLAGLPCLVKARKSELQGIGQTRQLFEAAVTISLPMRVKRLFVRKIKSRACVRPTGLSADGALVGRTGANAEIKCLLNCASQIHFLRNSEHLGALGVDGFRQWMSISSLPALMRVPQLLARCPGRIATQSDASITLHCMFSITVAFHPLARQGKHFPGSQP